jgi:hypothetical protein
MPSYSQKRNPTSLTEYHSVSTSGLAKQTPTQQSYGSEPNLEVLLLKSHKINLDRSGKKLRKF